MKKTNLYYAFLLLLLVLLACSQGTVASPTRVPTRTPLPTPTATPAVHSVCLQVDAGGYSERITLMAQALLSDLGMLVLPPGEACDASLVFDLTIAAYSAYYTNLNVGPGASCYTGAKVSGTCTYAVAGYAPRLLPVEKDHPTETGVIYTCPGPEETSHIEEILPDAIFEAFHTLWGDGVIFAASQDADADLRAQSIAWLTTVVQKNGPEAERAMAAILQAAQSDPEPVVRSIAVFNLGSVGVADDRILPALVAALGDTDKYVGLAAAITLGGMGEEAGIAVPALIQMLQDPDWMLRSKAAEALGKIGPVAAEAVPALTGLLEDEEYYVRRSAITSLGEIGPAAMQAVPALIQSLRREDGFARDSIATSLLQITGQDLGTDADAWQTWWDTQK